MNGETHRTWDPIPLDNVHSKFHWKWYPRLLRSIQRGHTLLIADHGVGKTLEGRVVAAEMKIPFFYMSATYGIEKAMLEGAHYPVVVDGHISLIPADGIIPSAVQHDGLLMIDEFFRLPQDVQACLFAAMDATRGEYTILYRGVTLRVGEKFRVLGSTNPPSPLYPEVEVADRALLSRFNRVLYLPFPDHIELAKYAAHIGFPKQYVAQAITFIGRVRKAYEKGDGSVDNFISPRDLKFFADALNDGLDVNEALEDTIVGKFSSRFHEAVRGFWDITKGVETIGDGEQEERLTATRATIKSWQKHTKPIFPAPSNSP